MRAGPHDGRGARGRWALPALGLLTLLVHLAFAVGTLESGAGPGEPASALGQASSLLVLLVPVLSVTGAAWVALGRDDTPGRPTARWTGGTLAAVGLARGIVPIVVLIGVSNSYDDPPGLFLLPGLVTLVLAGLLTATAARASHRWSRRALPAALALLHALLERSAPGWTAAAAAVLAAGAGAVLASRAGTVVLAESAFALVLALLGMVLAWRGGVGGVHGSRGSQSARSPDASA